MSYEDLSQSFSPRVDVPTASAVRRPPHPLDAQWHIFTNDQTFGPYTGHDLKTFVADGTIDALTNVVRVGRDTWTKAGDDPALIPLFRADKPAAPPAKLIAEKGATIVQVTNQIGPNLAALDLLDDLPSAKSPGLALFLSLIFCGAGQMYNGQVAKGILMLLGCVLLWLVSLGWIINFWSIIDAYATAKKLRSRYNRRLLAGVAA